MTCDRCQGPSCGPRCPRCVRTYGDAPTVNQSFTVEPATAIQTAADRSHGWESGDE